ncbi:MAG: response regulator [Solirubrobacteraceae bacterium]
MREECSEQGAAMRRIGVALAEDHAGLCRTFRQLIDAELDMHVTAELTEMRGVVKQLLGGRPDVLVLDAGMPEGSFLERVRQLRSLAPQTQIVLITMEDNHALADAAQAAGAVGFVLKDTADQELCEAVRSAARSSPFRSPRVTGGPALPSC